MAREDLHFRLRIPERLKKRVEEMAAANHRSMTAEIVSALEQYYGGAIERVLENSSTLTAETLAALEQSNGVVKSYREATERQSSVIDELVQMNKRLMERIDELMAQKT